MRSVSPVHRLLFLLAIVMVGTGSALALATGASAQQIDDIDCSLDTTGKTPLDDLGTGMYEGAEGGLYPNGSNQIPEEHEALGLLRAAEITPRDEAGNPDPDGKIAFVSIGVSNTRREFTAFLVAAGADPDIASSVVMVNGAQTGEPVGSWLDPADSVWGEFDAELAAAGVTAAQVQGAWVKIPERVTEGLVPFPDNALAYRDKLAAALRTVQDELPNLQVAYLSSRIYGGYSSQVSSNPEPHAYEEGFGVKWLIEQQMAGNPVINADPRRGAVVAPWVAWGPYIWADGVNPRSDGLTWECDEFISDGIHPNNDGSAKVADILLDFLASEPTATWMFGEPVAPTDPPPPGNVTTSTIAGDAGLSEATIPLPEGGSGPGETDGTVAPGTGSTDPDPESLTRRERREQERAEREEEQRERREGTSSTAVPGETGPGERPGDSTVAAAPFGDGDDVPPVVWVLAGVGVLMLLILAVRAVRDRIRARADGGPDPG